MHAQTLIFLASTLNGLTFGRGQPHHKLLIHPFALIKPLYDCPVLSTADEQTVVYPREAFAETQEVDRIEQVALPHAVVAEKAVDLSRQLKSSLGDILKIAQCQLIQAHI